MSRHFTSHENLCSNDFTSFDSRRLAAEKSHKNAATMKKNVHIRQWKKNIEHDSWREGNEGRAEIIALPCETSRGYNTASGELELGCAYGKCVFQRKVIPVNLYFKHFRAEVFRRKMPPSVYESKMDQVVLSSRRVSKLKFKS